MNKGYVFLCTLTFILSFFLVACDQTIVIHRDKGFIGFVETQGPSIDYANVDKGKGSKVTDISNPDIVPRPVIFQLTADYPEGEILPERILVNGKDTRSGDGFLPGSYSYRIEKAGYASIEKKFGLPPGVGDHIITETMVTLPREVRFNITDSLTGAKINPDRVSLRSEIKEGQQVKPGDYPLQVQKEGYQSVVEEAYNVPVGDPKDPVFITKKMTPAEVQLRFKFLDAETKEQIKADRIYLDEKLTSDGSYAKPKVSHKLSVYKRGYRTLKDSVTIGNPPVYEIEKELVRSTIVFKWRITSDYPGDELTPEVVLLNDKEVREEENIGSGKHKVAIKHPGFEIWKDEIVVPDDLPTYTLNAKLISLPRLIELAVGYDVSPSQEQSKKLGPYQVMLRNISTEESVTLESGTKVKPSTYEVYIKRTAYNPFKDRIRIMPSLRPYKINTILEAKHRVVQGEVEFDIDPPAELAPHVIDFIDMGSRIRRTVKLGGTIKPGTYNSYVSKEGYKMVGGERRIMIEPDEMQYQIPKAMMEAEPRKISFDTTYNGVSISAKSILVNGKSYQFEPLKPARYSVVIAFDQYETVEKDVIVPPGVGDYVAKVNLIPKK